MLAIFFAVFFYVSNFSSFGFNLSSLLMFTYLSTECLSVCVFGGGACSISEANSNMDEYEWWSVLNKKFKHYISNNVN